MAGRGKGGLLLGSTRQSGASNQRLTIFDLGNKTHQSTIWGHLVLGPEAGRHVTARETQGNRDD